MASYTTKSFKGKKMGKGRKRVRAFYNNHLIWTIYNFLTFTWVLDLFPIYKAKHTQSYGHHPNLPSGSWPAISAVYCVPKLASHLVVSWVGKDGNTHIGFKQVIEGYKKIFLMYVKSNILTSQISEDLTSGFQ